jgi:hypothetical protein
MARISSLCVSSRIGRMSRLDEVYERLYSVSREEWREEWDTRYERLGRHVDVVPHQRRLCAVVF